MLGFNFDIIKKSEDAKISNSKFNENRRESHTLCLIINKAIYREQRCRLSKNSPSQVWAAGLGPGATNCFGDMTKVWMDASEIIELDRAAANADKKMVQNIFQTK